MNEMRVLPFPAMPYFSKSENLETGYLHFLLICDLGEEWASVNIAFLTRIT